MNFETQKNAAATERSADQLTNGGFDMLQRFVSDARVRRLSIGRRIAQSLATHVTDMKRAVESRKCDIAKMKIVGPVQRCSARPIVRNESDARLGRVFKCCDLLNEYK